MPSSSENSPEPFDSLPDAILLHIFNRLSDIKTLTRCRTLSRRFSLLVPHTDSLLLTVDRVISAADSDLLRHHHHHPSSSSSPLLSLLHSLLRPLHSLLASFSSAAQPHHQVHHPQNLLRGFHHVRSLQVELPAGDLKLEKCTCIKWKAQFGKTLKFCVILAFRSGGRGGSGGAGEGGEGVGSFSGSGLKMRVVWTISALIAASARHYMILDAVKEHRGIESLVIRDREMEGVVVMDKEGLDECRESGEEEMESNSTSYDGEFGGASSRVDGVWWRNNRTTVPAVRMRMRHEPRMELSGGVVMEGATLVIVRPIGDGRGNGEGNDIQEQNDDVELAMRVFGGEGGAYAEAVGRLLHCRSYILEMNSF